MLLLRLRLEAIRAQSWSYGTILFDQTVTHHNACETSVSQKLTLSRCGKKKISIAHDLRAIEME